jgi:hypothetical protein
MIRCVLGTLSLYGSAHLLGTAQSLGSMGLAWFALGLAMLATLTLLAGLHRILNR